MRPQALERLGLDAASIRAKHPEKIYCLITGYGTDGPYAGQPTYDSVVQGVTGMAGLMLARDGAPSLRADADLRSRRRRDRGRRDSGGRHAERARPGSGASIEIPMFETMAAFVLQEHLAQHSFDPPVGPPAISACSARTTSRCKTADGWISFTINTDPQVRAFLKATDRSDLTG